MNRLIIVDTKKILSIILFIFIIFSSLSIDASSFNKNYGDEKIIDRIIKEIEITPSSDYVIKFSSDRYSLEEESRIPYSNGLSEKIKNAISKSPKWLQRELTRQFLEIDGEEYAELILESSKKYTDEIAFSIAFSALGKVPPVDLLLDNVLTLYENDKWINYADIIDYDNNDGNYYSTVRYLVIEDEIVKELEFPPDIYYWYIVPPSVTGEDSTLQYDVVWRDYLFNHNDLGYPLLKEKLSEIKYLWDCKSYYQSGHRTWDWSMSNHPTAIEAISYWIGKTVPEWAFGDRPGHPNVIAHEHNGWCGELQKLAVAAQRTALVPSVGIFNRGEDHVWREFYERGWHQNDNWWADGGGAVDKPEVYTYGWKKDMSAVHTIRCDSVIKDVTPTYIGPKESKTVTFKVLDRRFLPIDGARVTVSVEGPNDITWLRNKLLVTLEDIWDKIPDFLKGNILQSIYEKLKTRIEEIPDSVESKIYTIWKFTDINGYCAFELGENRSYTFFIQYGSLKKPSIPAWHNSIRTMKDPVDKDYVIMFPFLTPKKYNHKNQDMPNGEILFDVSFESISHQVQKNVLGQEKEGVRVGEGKIDFFIVDEENYLKYQDKRSFNCYNYKSDSTHKSSFNAPDSDWYLIFRNSCRATSMILNLSISVKTTTSDSIVTIVSPTTDIFDNPVANVGEKVIISGIATENILLQLNDETYEVDVKDYEWFYVWDTSGLNPDNYLIKAICNDAEDDITIKLVDFFPPLIDIDIPLEATIIEDELITIAGLSSDNLGVERVEVKIDNSDYRVATGIDYWSIDWDINDFNLGKHLITAKSIDLNGLVSYTETMFILNESGHSWGPNINSFYHKPENPTNISNIILFADVTSGSPFEIKKVVVHWDDGEITNSKDMFRYADNPIQERHEEDPLKNETNDPIYGLELGQFATGTNISYWIEAYDYANNRVVSSKNLIIIE